MFGTVIIWSDETVPECKMHRVLAVDDTEGILKLVQAVAQRMGFVAETLSNPERFMTAFVRFKPDVVMLDIMMPNIDGFEIIQRLTDVDYTGRLVIMSGYADQHRMARVLAGTNPRMKVTSLAKPFRIAALEAVLRGDPDIGLSS